MVTITTHKIYLEETEAPEFVEAAEINLFSQENENADMNCLAHKYKGIVDADNVKNIFNVVSPTYKLIQHREVYDEMKESVQRMGMAAKLENISTNEGARVRFQLTFPDVQVSIGNAEQGDIINLRIAIDNSYNATTGLRCIVSGYRKLDDTNLVVNDRLSRFYHKHTKGADVANLGESLLKGLKVFKDKIQKKWDKYYDTKVDPAKVRDLLRESIGKDEDDKKKVKVANKYLESMLAEATKKNVTNQFEFYALAAKVLTHGNKSIDSRDNDIREMEKFIQSNISKIAMS